MACKKAGLRQEPTLIFGQQAEVLRGGLGPPTSTIADCVARLSTARIPTFGGYQWEALAMPLQDLTQKPISAFVVAVGSFGNDGNFELEGTAFMIGARGFMLTAAHVAEALRAKTRPIAMFMDHTGAHQTAEIVDSECHDTQDVALLKLEDGEWASIHDLSPERQFGSAEVMMWAYPEVVAKERQNTVPPDHPEASKVQPDLIYLQGYIRRRISRELPVAILRGNAFYEVSQIGGACASGAPVTLRAPGKQWFVVGIYIGEQTSDARREIGIVVRTDAILDWAPRILGALVLDQHHTHV